LNFLFTTAGTSRGGLIVASQLEELLLRIYAEIEGHVEEVATCGGGYMEDSISCNCQHDFQIFFLMRRSHEANIEG